MNCFSGGHDGVFARVLLGVGVVLLCFQAELLGTSPYSPPVDMVWVSPGTFMMGSPTNEVDRHFSEGPQRQVTISEGFWIGRREVTQAEYMTVRGVNPSHFTGNSNRPVESVSWLDATAFCSQLTEQERQAGRLPGGYVYRLPTEAEWEYACRAGTTTRFSYGDDLGYGQLPLYAWVSTNSGSATHPVGQKQPNPWGLYDVHGNVWEWCQDWYGPYPGGDTGPVGGTGRVIRSGSYFFAGNRCRSAYRNGVEVTGWRWDLGFRVVLGRPLPPEFGSLLAAESFEYGVGSIDGQDGGVGFAGPFTGSGVVASGSLRYVDVDGQSFPVLGNRLVTDFVQHPVRELNRVGALPLLVDAAGKLGADGTVIYLGFLCASRTIYPTMFGGISLLDGTTEKLLVGDPSVSSSYWGFDALMGSNQVQLSSVPVDTNVHLLVARIDFHFGTNDETVRLYVDPSLDAEPVTPSAGPLNVPEFRFTHLRLTAPQVPIPILEFDEVRLGTTYESVVNSFTAPIVVREPVDTQVTEGGTAEFKVEAMGMAPLYYQWYFNGSNAVFRANLNTLILSNVSLAQAGLYSVRVSNVYGVAISTRALLTVNPAPGGPGGVDDGFLTGLGPDGPVFDLGIISSGQIVIGGVFTNVDGLMRPRVARLNANGVVDSGFNVGPGPDGAVRAVAVQADGKVMIAGSFLYVGLPAPRLPGIARLNANGDPDLAFNPGTGPGGGSILALAVQADGKIVVGGGFTNFNGASCGRLVRLHPNGSLDTNFVALADHTVETLTIQPDGKILVGGLFQTVNGTNRLRIARLNSDGSLDTAFTASADGTVKSIALQPDGRIVMGGQFLTVNGSAVSRVARLLPPDGARDSYFSTGDGPNGTVRRIVLQPDGKMLLAGDFSLVNGKARNRLARLEADGRLDTTIFYGSGPDGSVETLAVQPDGQILIGGSFTSINGLFHPYLARLEGGPLSVPTIVQQPSSRTVVAGETVSLSVVALGLPPPTYQWQRNGVDLLGATNALLVLSNVQPAQAGSYTVVASNPLGRVTSLPATLTVNAPPLITRQPQSRQAVLGSTVRFDVEASGTAPLAFQWYLNGVPLVGATNFGGTTSSLVLVDVQLERSGEYSVRVFNAFGSAVSAGAVLTVVMPPGIMVQPVGTNVHLGDPVQFCVAATGSPPFRYQWRKNGTKIPGATNACYSIPAVSLSDGGQYSVLVANAAGSLISDPAEMVVQVSGVPAGDDFSDRQVLDQDLARGSNLGATKEPNEPDHAGQAGGRSVWYTRQAGANGIVTLRTSGSSFDTLLAVYTGDSITNLTLVASDEDGGDFFSSEVRFNASAGTIFQVAVDGFDGASGDFAISWSLEPTTNRLPEITVPPLSQTVPRGSDATFLVTATGSGLSYQWLFDDAPITGATGSAFTQTNAQRWNVGFYSVIVSNDLGRFVKSPSALLEIGPVANVQSLGKIPNPTLTNRTNFFGGKGQGLGLGLTQPGGGILVGAGTTGSQIINNTNAPTQTGEPNHCGALGGSTRWLVLQASADGYDFSLDTEESEIPTVLAVYQRVSVLQALVEVTCNKGAGLVSAVSFPAQTGLQYWVAVDGAGGQEGIIQLNWRLGRAPVLAVTPLAQTLPVGDRVTWSVTVPDAFPPADFQWQYNGVPIPDATNSFFTLPDLQPTQAGLYSVVASNLMGAIEQPISTLSLDLGFRVLVHSDFESSAEDWLIYNGSEFAQPSYSPSIPGGNGYVVHSDGTDPSLWDWSAPAKFGGNQSAAYGGWLEFKLATTAIDPSPDAADVLLLGAGQTLVFDLLQTPSQIWTTLSIPLNETAGWHLTDLTGPAPTAAQLLAGLRAVDGWFIRGDYGTASHMTRLDDVKLIAPAETETVVLTTTLFPNNIVLLEWPASASGFQLQSAQAPDLTEWTPVSALPTLDGGFQQVLIDTGGTTLCFRLKKL